MQEGVGFGIGAMNGWGRHRACLGLLDRGRGRLTSGSHSSVRGKKRGRTPSGLHVAGPRAKRSSWAIYFPAAFYSFLYFFSIYFSDFFHIICKNVSNHFKQVSKFF
jgi:hypothetical protein